MGRGEPGGGWLGSTGMGAGLAGGAEVSGCPVEGAARAAGVEVAGAAVEGAGAALEGASCCGWALVAWVGVWGRMGRVT